MGARSRATRRAAAVAMTAIGWLVLPWAVLALVLVLRHPPEPLPATTNEPATSEPKHCADADVTRQLLEVLPHTAPLLRALASFQAVSTEYYFPDLCPEER